MRLTNVLFSFAAAAAMFVAANTASAALILDERFDDAPDAASLPATDNTGLSSLSYNSGGAVTYSTFNFDAPGNIFASNGVDGSMIASLPDTTGIVSATVTGALGNANGSSASALIVGDLGSKWDGASTAGVLFAVRRNLVSGSANVEYFDGTDWQVIFGTGGGQFTYSEVEAELVFAGGVASITSFTVDGASVTLPTLLDSSSGLSSLEWNKTGGNAAYGDAFSIDAVIQAPTAPEPASIVLAAIGLVGLGFSRRRRRR